MAKFPHKLKRFRTLLLKDLTRTPTDIAFEVYNCKDRLVARVIASQNLAKLNIDLYELFERAGLTDENDVEFLKDKLNAEKMISANVYIKDFENIKEGTPLAEMKEADGVTKDFIGVPDNKTRLKAFELLQKLKGRLKATGEVGDQHTHFTIIYGHRNLRKTEESDNLRTVRS